MVVAVVSTCSCIEDQHQQFKVQVGCDYETIIDGFVSWQNHALFFWPMSGVLARGMIRSRAGVTTVISHIRSRFARRRVVIVGVAPVGFVTVRTICQRTNTVNCTAQLTIQVTVMIIQLGHNDDNTYNTIQYSFITAWQNASLQMEIKVDNGKKGKTK